MTDAATRLRELLERARENAADTPLDPFINPTPPPPERPYPPALPRNWQDTDEKEPNP